jgi:hypothetical protein
LEKLKPDDFTVMSGQNRYACLVQRTGRIGADGKFVPDFRVAFLVPRAVTAFAFRLRSDTVRITAPPRIQSNIR